MKVVPDCTGSGAFRNQLAATVSTMSGIVAETEMAGCYEFITTCSNGSA
jgi:hypothetical protein